MSAFSETSSCTTIEVCSFHWGLRDGANHDQESCACDLCGCLREPASSPHRGSAPNQTGLYTVYATENRILRVALEQLLAEQEKIKMDIQKLAKELADWRKSAAGKLDTVEACVVPNEQGYGLFGRLFCRKRGDKAKIRLRVFYT
jgi:hypothetical protein